MFDSPQAPAEIKAALEAISKWPWCLDERAGKHHVYCDDSTGSSIADCSAKPTHLHLTDEQAGHNAAFIANAPSYVQALLTENERLTTQLAASVPTATCGTCQKSQPWHNMFRCFQCQRWFDETCMATHLATTHNVGGSRELESLEREVSTLRAALAEAQREHQETRRWVAQDHHVARIKKYGTSCTLCTCVTCKEFRAALKELEPLGGASSSSSTTPARHGFIPERICPAVANDGEGVVHCTLAEGHDGVHEAHGEPDNTDLIHAWTTPEDGALCGDFEPDAGYACTLEPGHSGDHRCTFGEDEYGPIPDRTWPVAVSPETTPTETETT